MKCLLLACSSVQVTYLLFLPRCKVIC
uniref:Uncharacterized protein n=1 Tax=Rhizophora mucronata TaxID=61149 RepID=A0A2P2PFX1_RHIMU